MTEQDRLKQNDNAIKMTNLCRTLENDLVVANSIIEAIEEILDGKEVSDFMLSFPIVRCVDDLMQAGSGRRS